MGGVFGFNDFTRINSIDHARVGLDSPEVGATAEYGQYLTNIAICGECHGPNLAGVVLAEGEDGPPEGPNLTPGGELADWSEADFINTLRTGQTPSGEQLDAEQMPWPRLGQMSDTELQAIWAYLSSLPPLPTNESFDG
jgi:mono/diheme cytochrome c family protein